MNSALPESYRWEEQVARLPRGGRQEAQTMAEVLSLLSLEIPEGTDTNLAPHPSSLYNSPTR